MTINNPVIALAILSQTVKGVTCGDCEYSKKTRGLYPARCERFGIIISSDRKSCGEPKIEHGKTEV